MNHHFRKYWINEIWNHRKNWLKNAINDSLRLLQYEVIQSFKYCIKKSCNEWNIFSYQQILANLWLGHCNALFSLFWCCFLLSDLEMLGKNLHGCNQSCPTYAVIWLVKTVKWLKCWLTVRDCSWLSYIKLMNIGRKIEVI